MNSRSPFGQGWWGLLFGLSGGVLLIDPLQGRADFAQTVAAIVGAVVFMGLFAFMLWDWRHDRSGLWQTATIAAMGLFFAPFNSFGWIFLVLALAFSAPGVMGNGRSMALIVGGIATLALVEKMLAGLPWSFVGMVVGYGVPTAVMTAVTLRRNLAVREIARYNERERISRDMHDVLGHTLSVIALKTDLAMRLVHANPDRALSELGDVDRLARRTLEEVRQTLRGYRAQSLEQELAVARDTLSLAGIGVVTEFSPPRLHSVQENVLCLALREAVTNVIRHSGAKNCRLAVAASRGDCVLEIADDGERQTDGNREPSAGMGLAGMRERVEGSGGSVTVQVERGTRLTIRLPGLRSQEGS